MRALNFNHLHYFWVVAREGSLAAAAELLHLTPQTISSQLKLLEEDLGQPLFRRSGRRLRRTPAGDLAFQYADDMFSLGTELREALSAGATPEMSRLVVGTVDVLPKLITLRLLAPALSLPLRLVCREGSLENLLVELATYRIDAVLADRPIGSPSGVKAFSHYLGESDTSFFATTSLAQTLADEFPAALHGAPMLLPSHDTYPRRHLDMWLEEHELIPKIVGEFDDTALMKAFGQQGLGVFPAPSVISREVCLQYRVTVVGHTQAIKERYYAITISRKVQHPAVAAVTEAAPRLLSATDAEQEPAKTQRGSAISS